MKTHAGRKLSRTGAHRKALLRNMAASLLKHEQVKTTSAKAKEVSRLTEWLISKSLKQDLNSKKAVIAEINDADVRKKLFDVLVTRYQGRKSGFTRIFKVGRRLGDGAEVSIVKLIQ